MPLARHFTLRLGRRDTAAAPSRSPSVRKEISLPINLLSSTNTQSFASPDLDQARKAATVVSAAPAPAPSSAHTCRSSSDQDSAPSSPDTPSLTDASSLESSPALEYNHLSAYFPTQPKTGGMLSHVQPPPAIPRRVPSHSKKEHERLARKRSLRLVDSAPSPDSSQPVATAPPVSPHMPTSTMEQVVEDVQEEEEQDAAHMLHRGLQKVSASDYQDVIGSMRWSTVSTVSSNQLSGWI